MQEELKWKQRSRVHWLKAGDANTKIFHLKANTRRIKNFISRFTNGLSIHTDHASMAYLLFNFFKNQLGTEASFVKSVNLPLLYAKEDIDLHSLQEPFSKQEVRSAVFSCALEKALGSDGFPLLFYQ